jgi:hypothetical protein
VSFDFELGELYTDFLGNVTPVLRHRQTVDSRIRKRIPRAADRKQGQNLHRMETRSKSGRNTHRLSSGSEKAKAWRKGA